MIVIGGGHAGAEAALACARMGHDVLMLSHSLDNIALMPCNPSIGGPAKGLLVREIDALGGEQAIAADASTMHLRWLNTSKGMAVRALRAQCDLREYAKSYMDALYAEPRLRVYQAMAVSIEADRGRAAGVLTEAGERIAAERVIVAAGTYMRGVVHMGLVEFPSGPIGQVPSRGLSESIERLGIRLGRFRTDTTPRLVWSSVDWTSLPRQESDPEPEAFSHWSEPRRHDGYFCAHTRTCERTHEIIRSAFGRSPLAARTLTSKGPRYCPSIDDKIIRFPDRDTHPIFLEPVGRDLREVYMQNFSTSMPPDVQIEMVRSLPGCERAVITRPGYGIEYDYVMPDQLEPWLESRDVRGLWFAGQVCGTSGYEEAASQGLIAGINASLSIEGRPPLVLGRDRAYIGVLIDDITNRGVDEPYRMLPSRCEHRLIMRHDDADDRLCDIGRELGLIGDDRWRVIERRREQYFSAMERVARETIPASDEVNALLDGLGSSRLDEPVRARVLLKRPEVSWRTIADLIGAEVPRDVGRKVETAVKYEGYSEREERRAMRMSAYDRVSMPDDLDLRSIPGLSAEDVEKLSASRPRTLGAASRIPGITPTGLQLLHVAIERARRARRDG